jgi:hypothetical protein
MPMPSGESLGEASWQEALELSAYFKALSVWAAGFDKAEDRGKVASFGRLAKFLEVVAHQVRSKAGQGGEE